MGVDTIPEFVKQSKLFTGNDLGRLGNIAELPAKEELEEFKTENSGQNFTTFAKELVQKNEVKKAWMAILTYEKTIN